jgi:VIT1/CCC1 family predicted Fe2+/Mn2+ transporter
MMAEPIDDYLAVHYVQRSNWLRAAVLGANDGILPTSSLAIDVAAASDLRDPILFLGNTCRAGSWRSFYGCWRICKCKFTD